VDTVVLVEALAVTVTVAQVEQVATVFLAAVAVQAS
jgi:hypothetical protein